MPRRTSKVAINKEEKKPKAPKKTTRRTKKTAESKEAVSTPVHVLPEAHIVYEREEVNKKMIMWFGVIIITLLLTVIWLFNLRYTFKQINAQNPEQSIDIEKWKDAASDLDSKIKQIKTNMDSLTDEATGTPAIATSTVENATSTATSTISNEDMENLKQVLNEL